MTQSKNKHVLVIFLLLIALLLTTAPALAQPATQTNLLQNADFEGGVQSNGIPNNWGVWAIVQNQGTSATQCLNWADPTYGITGGAQSGSTAGSFTTQNASHNAGFYQTVTGLTAGATYQFTIYGSSFSRDSAAATSFSGVKMLVGLDTAGGSDATSSSIIWSSAYDPRGSYAQLSVQATATGTSMTVFTRSTPDWCMNENLVKWDNASFTSLSQAPTAESATAAPTDPPQSQLSTPDANGRIVHTVQTGDNLSNLAFRYGVPMDQIRQLNSLTNDIVVRGTRLVIQAGNNQQAAATEAPTEDVAADATEEATAEATEEVPTEEATEEVAVVATGSLCINSYEDANANGIHEPGEPALANVVFSLSANGQQVGNHTSTGSGEFYCFDGLTEGNYIVTWVGNDMTPTTEQQWTAGVTAGSIQTREFGIQSAMSAQAAGDSGQPVADDSLGDGSSNGLPTWLIALLGAFGVIIFIAGIGALVYFFFIRRQQAI